MLMFNIPGYPSKPFYVRQARGLTQRFGKHQMITWHVARFGPPPRVYIAGLVRAETADVAEQNLIARLRRAGIDGAMSRVRLGNVRDPYS